MAWCRQATSHYLGQCWPKSPMPYGVNRPQWVNILRPEQNCRHFADDISECIFLNEISIFFYQISPISIFFFSNYPENCYKEFSDNHGWLIMKTSPNGNIFCITKLFIIGSLWGFPSQRAGNMEHVSMWLHHHKPRNHWRFVLQALCVKVFSH